MSGRLGLNHDVYFCITEGVGIFLDLARDEYVSISLPSELASAQGLPSESEVLLAFEGHRQDLLSERLVVDGVQVEGGLTAYQQLRRPENHIFGPDDQRAFGLGGEKGAAMRLRPRDLIDFLIASRRASVLLGKRHLIEVVTNVRERKARFGKEKLDLETLRKETTIFRTLRPWYPRSYLCLFDGLALIEFLARRRLFPDWVFAVQAQPFGAHCWLQAGEHLLNESTEYTRDFTPIMVI